MTLKPGRAYWISWECRDIGYGIDAGYGEFVYRGPHDHWGKHEFTPVGGGKPVYLFPDEITGVS